MTYFSFGFVKRFAQHMNKQIKHRIAAMLIVRFADYAL
jgi:hypothetical protein